jgi:glycogen(starch) synthase
MMQAATRHVLMTTDAVGGVWTYALDLAEGFAEHGVRVTLAVLGPAPDACAARSGRSRPGTDLVETDLDLDWTAPTPGDLASAAEGLRMPGARQRRRSRPPQQPRPGGGPGLRPPGRQRRPLLPGDLVGRRPPDRNARGLPLAHPAPLAGPAGVRRGYRAQRGLRRRHRADLRNPPPLRRPQRSERAPATFIRPKQRAACTAGRLWDDGKNIAVLDAAAARIDAPLLAAGPLRGPNGEERAAAHAQALGSMSAQAVRRTFAQARSSPRRRCTSRSA